MAKSAQERFLAFRKQAGEEITKDQSMKIAGWLNYNFVGYPQINKFIVENSEKYGFIRKLTTEAVPEHQCNILKSELIDLESGKVVYEASRLFYVYKEGKNTNHNTGINESYAKRYCDSLLLDICPEDDIDGTKLDDNPNKKTYNKQERKQNRVEKKDEGEPNFGV